MSQQLSLAKKATLDFKKSLGWSFLVLLMSTMNFENLSAHSAKTPPLKKEIAHTPPNEETEVTPFYYVEKTSFGSVETAVSQTNIQPGEIFQAKITVNIDKEIQAGRAVFFIRIADFENNTSTTSGKPFSVQDARIKIGNQIISIPRSGGKGQTYTIEDHNIRRSYFFGPGGQKNHNPKGQQLAGIGFAVSPVQGSKKTLGDSKDQFIFEIICRNTTQERSNKGRVVFGRESRGGGGKLIIQEYGPPLKTGAGKEEKKGALIILNAEKKEGAAVIGPMKKNGTIELLTRTGQSLGTQKVEANKSYRLKGFTQKDLNEGKYTYRYVADTQ